MRKHVSKKSTKKSPQNGQTILYLLFILIMVVVSTIFIQSETNDIRNRAQEESSNPTPLLRCNVPCSFDSQCPSGLTCHEGACRNPNCSDRSNCTCIITPTPGPTSIIVIQPTAVPTATLQPTITILPTPTTIPITITSTIESTPFPTIEPTPVFEAYGEEPKNISLLEAILQFVGNTFCTIFRVC